METECLFCLSVFSRQIESYQFSPSVVSDSLRAHGLQHSRLPLSITNSRSLLKRVLYRILSQLVSELPMECSSPALCSYRAKPRPRTGSVGSNPAFLSALYLHHHQELQVVLASSSALEAEDCTLLVLAGLQQTCRMCGPVRLSVGSMTRSHLDWRRGV